MRKQQHSGVVAISRDTKWYVLGGAAVALAGGMAIYLLARDPQRVYFLAGWWSHRPLHGAFFATVGAWLPSLVHAYVLSLLTAALLRPTRGAVFGACLMWYAIDTLFELGQHPALSPLVASALPKWFAHVPVLDQAGRYFLFGTFDVRDLLAIAAGALAAALTSFAALHKRGCHA